MASSRAIKRESLLSNRVYSNNFVLAYDFISKNLGVFFAIGAKNAGPIRRNRIKRVFRDLLRKDLKDIKFRREDLFLSVCLIAKKGIKLNADMPFIKEELQKLVEKLHKKIK